jgi:hypothetical protein
MKLTISLPLKLVVNKRTKKNVNYILNLNVYRNTHYRSLAKHKIDYKELVKKALAEAAGACPVDLKPPLRFTYTIYPQSRRKFDIANVCSVIQKFTDDALIDLGVIEDDNMTIVAEVNYRFGSVDQIKPRAVLKIEEIGRVVE